MHATYVRDQVSITHHGEHGPAAVVDLGLLEPLEVLRHGGEAQGVEAEVTARRSRHTRFRTRSSVRCLLILFFFFSGLVDRFLPGGGAVEVSGAGLAGHPLGGHGDAAGGGGVGAEQRQPAAPGRRRQQARHAHGAAAPQTARRRHRHTCSGNVRPPRRSGVRLTAQQNLRLLLIKSTTRLGWGYPNAAHHWLQYLLHPAPLGHVHRGIFGCPTWHGSSSPPEERTGCTAEFGSAIRNSHTTGPCPALPSTYPTVSRLEYLHRNSCKFYPQIQTVSRCKDLFSPRLASFRDNRSSGNNKIYSKFIFHNTIIKKSNLSARIC
jgi:hypothetical protein